MVLPLPTWKLWDPLISTDPMPGTSVPVSGRVFLFRWTSTAVRRALAIPAIQLSTSMACKPWTVARIATALVSATEVRPYLDRRVIVISSNPPKQVVPASDFEYLSKERHRLRTPDDRPPTHARPSDPRDLPL